MKSSFVLFTDIWPMIQKLDRGQRGDLFTAIMQYAVGEDPGEIDDLLTDMAFGFIKAQMDRSAAKYQEICLKRAEYGRKGGLAKASKSKQKLANVAKSESEPDPDPKSEPESESESEAQAPWESLSPEEAERLQEVYGSRAENLVEDVRLYYQSHPERTFPGWPVAMATFDRNQERWGRANVPKNIDEIMAMAFKGVD